MLRHLDCKLQKNDVVESMNSPCVIILPWVYRLAALPTTNHIFLIINVLLE